MLELEWTTGGQTQIIDFDVADSEMYESPADISDHAVESGAAVSDFVRPGNKTFTVEAWASNHPIVAKTYGMDGATGETRQLSVDIGNGRTVSASTFQVQSSFDRVRAIDEQLEALQDSAQLLTVRTSLRERSNVVIQNQTITRDPSTGNVLAVKIDFRIIRIASTQRTTLANSVPSQRRGQQTQNRGNQAGTTTPVPDSAGYRLAAAAGVVPP